MTRSILMAGVAVLAMASGASAGGFGVYYDSSVVGQWAESTTTTGGVAAAEGNVLSGSFVDVTGTAGIGIANPTFAGKAGALSADLDGGLGYLANSTSTTSGGTLMGGEANVQSGPVVDWESGIKVWGNKVPLASGTKKPVVQDQTLATQVGSTYEAGATGGTLFGASISKTSGNTVTVMENGTFGGVSTSNAANYTIGTGASFSAAGTEATVFGHTTFRGNAPD